MEYLYRLNVAEIRAKIPIRDGSLAIPKEHVNHNIGNLDDRILTIMLTILRMEMRMILKKPCKNAKTWMLKKLTPRWG